MLALVRNDVHQTQPRALSITNATEYGLVYTPTKWRRWRAVPGARARLPHGRRPLRQRGGAHRRSVADLTWRAGVDALSFGLRQEWRHVGEVLIFFGDEHRQATLYRRKRAGHLLSKGRFMAAQVLAMLEGDVWLRNARAANDAAARLAAAAPERLVLPVEANELFIRVSPQEAQALRDQGFDFYDWGPGEARLVTSWDSDPRRSTRSPPRSPPSRRHATCRTARRASSSLASSSRSC
jgi:threonine aldolase